MLPSSISALFSRAALCNNAKDIGTTLPQSVNGAYMRPKPSPPKQIFESVKSRNPTTKALLPPKRAPTRLPASYRDEGNNEILER